MLCICCENVAIKGICQIKLVISLKTEPTIAYWNNSKHLRRLILQSLRVKMPLQIKTWNAYELFLCLMLYLTSYGVRNHVLW